MNSALHTLLTRKLVDQGQLVEVGWKVFENQVVPDHAGEHQRTDMRAAFFAGAQHLFQSIVSMVKEREATGDDIERMRAISREIAAFDAEMKLRMQRPGGSA